MDLKQSVYNNAKDLTKHLRDNGFYYGAALTLGTALASPWIGKEVYQPIADFINLTDGSPNNIFDGFSLASQITRQGLEEGLKQVSQIGLSDTLKNTDLTSLIKSASLGAIPLGLLVGTSSAILGSYILEKVDRTLQRVSSK